MTPSVAAFLCGTLFALGLGVSGMTQPAKVLAFLDVAGRWDPSLALVMLGAIGVHAPIARLVLRRHAPVLAPGFHLPASATVDMRLVSGAAVFGVGWGLAGLCPGPAITVMASGNSIIVAFVSAMLAGMALVSAAEHGMASRVTELSDIEVLASSPSRSTRRGRIRVHTDVHLDPRDA